MQVQRPIMLDRRLLSLVGQGNGRSSQDPSILVRIQYTLFAS